MSPTTTLRPATERTRNYLHALLNERDLFASPKYFDAVNAMDAGELAWYNKALHLAVDSETMGQSEASAWIERLKELPRKERRSDKTVGNEPEAGMYRQPGGQIVRVYYGQQSGLMLLKNLVDTGVAYEDGHGTIHEYNYIGRAAYNLSADAAKLSLAEAQKYGRMSGTCCRCGRQLDVPESVERGIGPVCAGKVGEWA